MAAAVEYDILADRNTDHVETWIFLWEDFTGSTFKLQARPTKDTIGTPLLEHSTSTGSFVFAVETQSVAAHIAEGNLASDIYKLTNPMTGDLYKSTDSVLLTRLRFGTIAFYSELFPYPEERGEDLVCYYDVIRTPPGVGANPELILKGKYIILAGVTLP